MPVQEDVQFALEVRLAETAAPPVTSWARAFVYRVAGLGPGVAITAAVAAVATALGGLVPVIGAPVIAIVGGIALSLVRRPSARLQPGIAFSSKNVLKGSIVVFGSGLSLSQVLSTGGKSLPVLVGTLVTALAMAWLAGRLLGLRGDVLTMVGVGTAV